MDWILFEFCGFFAPEITNIVFESLAVFVAEAGEVSLACVERSRAPAESWDTEPLAVGFSFATVGNCVAGVLAMSFETFFEALLPDLCSVDCGFRGVVDQGVLVPREVIPAVLTASCLEESTLKTGAVCTEQSTLLNPAFFSSGRAFTELEIPRFSDVRRGVLSSVDGLGIAETTAGFASDLSTAAQVPFGTIGAMVSPGFFLSSIKISLVMFLTLTGVLLAVLEFAADAASFIALLHAKYECPRCIPGSRWAVGFWLAVLDGGC